MSVTSKSLRAKLPPDRLFFMAAIPTSLCESKESIVRTDASGHPQALAKVLREMANFYDPQS